MPDLAMLVKVRSHLCVSVIWIVFPDPGHTPHSLLRIEQIVVFFFCFKADQQPTTENKTSLANAMMKIHYATLY